MKGSRRLDNQDNQRLYTDLSWLWPVVSPVEDYRSEAQEFLRVISKYARLPVRSLLDMGCGGGHNDHYFQDFFSVVGVDTSAEMLSLARRLNPKIDYKIGDMRSLQLAQMFDAVIVADSIGYMLNEADLLATFSTAFRHLNPGGVFCTYAEETPQYFEQNETYHSTHQVGDLEVTLVENYYDPDPDDTTYEISFVYLVRKAGKLTIELDLHLAGIFPEDTWIRLMREAGFNVKQEIFTDEGFPFFISIRPG